MLEYNVPEYKKLRVIIDTDAACEADDPYAIAHALMSKKLEVKGICAEQFGSKGTVQRSYEEIKVILEAMNISIPVCMGEDGIFSEAKQNEFPKAVDLIIDEANKTDEKPLYILCLGAITNVALTLKKCPEIYKKITVIWIGGHSYEVVKPNHCEFNAGNDVDAVNFVISSGVEFWQIPNNVYGTMHVGIAELQKKVSHCGKIGKHLFENLINYNMSKYAGWTAGESWSLGDSPAVGVALEPNCGSFEYCDAPIFNEDTSYTFGKLNRRVRVYKSINSRFILEDFFSKLELIYGE